MSSIYYDSQLTAQEIEAALEAVSGLIVPANNGKIIAVENSTLVAKDVSEYGATLGSKTITENGTYLASGDDLDGYNQVIVNVSGGGGGGGLTPVSVTPTIITGAYIGTDARFYTGRDNKYRSLAINISQYSGVLIRVQNTGSLNTYGIYGSISSSMNNGIYSSPQYTNGDFSIYIDSNIASKGYFVYCYTGTTQDPPTVIGYSVTLP